MSFGKTTWEDTLPAYLTAPEKTRLKEGLAQFFNPEHRQKTKRYDNFYLNNPPTFFMQGDLINSLPVYFWDYDSKKYLTGFAPVILVSNSCDVSPKEGRLLDKEALFAHLIPLDDYINDLKEEGYTSDHIASIYNNLNQQTYSNLLYLPPNPIDKREFIVFFDKIFWHPAEGFLEKLADINTERFLSLDIFGFYLFICKLSYHFCRVPEESERSSMLGI